MKKIFLVAFVVAVLFSRENVSAQITVDHVYTIDRPGASVKLSSGLKYISIHYVLISPAPQLIQSATYFVLYNPDHSIYRTINIPQISGKYDGQVAFVSDALFDLDTLIEYLLLYTDMTTYVNSVAVLNENGITLLHVDSAFYSVGAFQSNLIYGPIFPDGNQTKLYINTNYPPAATTTTTVYNLPGRLACLECDSGFVIGIAQPPGLLSEENQSLAYPNPSADYIKIKYSLPPGFKQAFVNLYDISGKLIKQKEIDGQYDDIYLSTEEINQGAYSYAIVVDGKRMTSGKIIKL